MNTTPCLFLLPIKQWIKILWALVIGVSLSGCVAHKPIITSSFDDTVTLQAHVNSYFHADVIPPLRECWDELNTEGSVTFVHHYGLDGNDGWMPVRLELGVSTLTDPENQIALTCMRKAVAGTVMPVGAIEAGEQELVLHWRWAVPLPTEMPERKALFLGAGGRVGSLDNDFGCDGNGAVANCMNCDGLESACVTACVGYNTCEEKFDAGGAICIAKGACASGGAFGSVGIGLGVGGGGLSF